MQKSSILTIVSIVLALALIMVGILSFNYSKEIKNLESEANRIKNINNALNLENTNLVEQNKSANESLEQQKEKIEKYIKLLEATNKENDKIYVDLQSLLSQEQANKKIISEKLKTALEQANLTLSYVNSKIDENKENQEVVKILQEIRSNLEAIVNND